MKNAGRFLPLFLLFFSLVDLAGEVVVVSIEVDIDGKTHSSAIRRELSFSEDSVFADTDEFEQNLHRDIQELKNLRLFSALEYEISYRYPENRPGGSTDSGSLKTEAAVRIVAVDTWSVFPFIVPNSGGEGAAFTLAIVDKNFMGSLTEMRISGSMRIQKEPSTDKYQVRDWDTYLQWSGYTTGRWQLSGRISQAYVTERKYSEDVLIEDMSYYSTQAVFDARYEFAFLRNLFLHLIPQVSFLYGYEVRVDDGKIDQDSFRGGLGLALDYNRVDWRDFYRRGWSFGLFENFWINESSEGPGLRNALVFRTSGHLIAGQTNPNARTVLFSAVGHEVSGLGHWLRGVRDDSMYGDWALFLNTGIQFRILSTRQLEIHLQPFCDIGFAVPENSGLDLSRDFHAGLGSEILFFFPTLPSMQFRGYAGTDLTVRDWSSSGKWEFGLAFRLAY